ncbi:MAG TPA: PP2C family protein-serine/threonine phosphatase, partial [Candidatus Acidoferrum sp.]|nr:PP2C family protein-serine/threonine phosphatase [Candidatus Acidoferrum sp.]
MSPLTFAPRTTDPLGPAVQKLTPARSGHQRKPVVLLPLLRKDVAISGPIWLPLVLVLGALAAVAYADHLVVSISLVYLYILPLAVGAIFLRKELSYILVVICVLFHDYDSPRPLNPGLRIFHNLSAMLCFAFVVYVIQRYMEQREALAKTVQQQRDELLKDVELAAHVQRLFLPVGKPNIAGLEIAGMTQPVRGVSGDYYDYIPIDAHTTQIIIADVAGKGVPAALLMSATAAAMRFEGNRGRNMLEQVERLNTGMHSVSDDDRYVTLLLAEIDVHKRTIQYVNCGHNPALLFRATTGTLARLISSCPPIGISPEESCELASIDLSPGDVVVFYTDGVTEAENRFGGEFGIQRLSEVVRRGSSRSAEDLMVDIYNTTADFCGDHFNDDVTILVVKFDFNTSPAATS